MNKKLEILMLKNAIRMAVGGYMYDNLNAEIDEIPEILEEIANDYREEIKKQTN